MRIEAHLPALHRDLQQIATAARPRETCGVITADGMIYELPNRAADPTRDFDLGPLHVLDAEFPGFLAIWHTHPDNETPSPLDIAGCAATAKPWVIAGPDCVWALHPKQLPLLERDFVYGIEDCWQLVSDWFAQERSVYLPWFPRPPDGWWKTEGESPYLEAAQRYGFNVSRIEDVGFAHLCAGDVLLMQVLGKRPNHTGVYMGGGRILHHLYGCLSTVEQLTNTWQDRTKFVGRHASFQ